MQEGYETVKEPTFVLLSLNARLVYNCSTVAFKCIVGFSKAYDMLAEIAVSSVEQVTRLSKELATLRNCYLPWKGKDITATARQAQD